jgi:hypothetical protein
MSYHLTIEEHPLYLHTAVSGTHSLENARRFLQEAYAACVERGYTDVLLEMNLTGPSLDLGSIFAVVAQRSADAVKLRRVAYVDASSRDPEKKRFAETVAVNRGVNARLFRDLEEARRWLCPEGAA